MLLILIWNVYARQKAGRRVDFGFTALLSRASPPKGPRKWGGADGEPLTIGRTDVFEHRDTSNSSAPFVSFVYKLCERRAVPHAGWHEDMKLRSDQSPSGADFR